MGEHGGARPNAGRPKGGKNKPTLIQEAIKARAIEECHEEAMYALGLFVALQHDESQSVHTREIAAREVLDRVWGKPTQRNVNEDSGAITLEVIQQVVAPKEEQDNAPEG